MPGGWRQKEAIPMPTVICISVSILVHPRFPAFVITRVQVPHPPPPPRLRRTSRRAGQAISQSVNGFRGRGIGRGGNGWGGCGRGKSNAEIQKSEILTHPFLLCVRLAANQGRGGTRSLPGFRVRRPSYVNLCATPVRRLKGIINETENLGKEWNFACGARRAWDKPVGRCSRGTYLANVFVAGM
jgi:hypothetical protein